MNQIHPMTHENANAVDRGFLSWQKLRDWLIAIRRSVFNELRNYPPQVAGCDLHYTDSAEKRDLVCRETEHLDTLRRMSADELQGFVFGSSFVSVQNA